MIKWLKGEHINCRKKVSSNFFKKVSSLAIITFLSLFFLILVHIILKVKSIMFPESLFKIISFRKHSHYYQNGCESNINIFKQKFNFEKLKKRHHSKFLELIITVG